MKKVLGLLAPLALIFAGCAKEMIEMPEIATGEGPVFSATYVSEDGTRTVMDSNQGGVLWSATDKINVFDSDNDSFEYSASGAGASTTFTKSGGQTPVETETWYALYPYDPEASISDGIITTNGSIIIKNTYDEITALRETGNKIVLDTNKTAVIRLYKDSFTLGSYEEFKSLIKEKTGLSL